MVTDLLWLIFFSLLLIKATDILLVNLKSFAKRLKIGAFVLGGLAAALTTSLPELFVGLAAALRAEPSLSLGNVVGANIANLSLVIGGAALIGGTLKVQGNFLSRDVFYAFLAGAAPMLLLMDKTLSRLDGVILLAIYLFYQVVIFRQQSGGSTEGEMVHRLIHHVSLRGTKKEFFWIFVGVAVLLFSANMLVDLGAKVAATIGLPLLVVGMVWVAIGTTLPELIFEAEAIKKRQPEMVFGNLLGSIVANGTLVLGVVAVIAPFKIEAFAQYLLATITFVLVFGLFYFFIRTKRRLERWEGAVLALVWLVFVLAEFLK